MYRIRCLFAACMIVFKSWDIRKKAQSRNNILRLLECSSAFTLSLLFAVLDLVFWICCVQLWEKEEKEVVWVFVYWWAQQAQTRASNHCLLFVPHDLWLWETSQSWLTRLFVWEFSILSTVFGEEEKTSTQDNTCIIELSRRKHPHGSSTFWSGAHDFWLWETGARHRWRLSYFGISEL